MYIQVDGIVCDGSTTNRGIWKQLGISGRIGEVVSSIPHPVIDVGGKRDTNDRLFVLSDYVHLMKCVRNNLLNKKEFEVGCLTV